MYVVHSRSCDCVALMRFFPPAILCVSCWVLQTLKNNNARLKTALQESASNVEEWKTQLTAWKEECIRLRAQVKELRASGDTASQASAELTTAKSECEDLRAKVAALEREKSALVAQSNVRCLTPPSLLLLPHTSIT
jgi:septal ring factor EnvC (AmiA/AmiB activator)